MQTYRELYFRLFRALRDATELLEQGNVISALDFMIQAQQEAENAHLDADFLLDE